MDADPGLENTRQLLANLWYSICATYFKRVVDVTGLDKEREEALRALVLRPNDFKVLTAAEAEEPAEEDN